MTLETEDDRSQGHATKNAGGQVASSCKVIYMGAYFVDLGGAVANGLPKLAYLRKDPQSDLQNALTLCPQFYIAGSAEDLSLARPQWHGRGTLLFSLSTAMRLAPEG